MTEKKWRLEDPEKRRKQNRKLRDESGGQEWARLERAIEKAGITPEIVEKKLEDMK